jgi:hypothetical protein
MPTVVALLKFSPLSKSLADTLEGDGGNTRKPHISHAYQAPGVLVLLHRRERGAEEGQQRLHS